VDLVVKKRKLVGKLILAEVLAVMVVMDLVELVDFQLLHQGALAATFP
jgi:hypothetical protein